MIEELQKLDEFYKDNSVYKSLFICSGEIQEELYKNLLDFDHSVINCKTTDDMIHFHHSNHRLILIPIEIWKEKKYLINRYILPYQNLIILYDLSEYQHILIKHWIRIVNKKKYIIDPEAKIINLDDY